jgi:hypothetical protein
MQIRKPVSFVATQEPEAATLSYRDILGLDLIETSPFASKHRLSPWFLKTANLRRI